MGENEVNITYETLFELLRREKGREDLQELDKSFFRDVVQYLADKRKMLESSDKKLFSGEEGHKLEQQLRNIRKILSELYSRRERKIISMALSKSRVRDSIINTSVMLEEEKKLYDDLTATLTRYRESILDNILDERMPGDVHSGKDLDSGDGEQGREAQDAPEQAENPKEQPKELKTEGDSPQKSTKTVRFLSAVPKFVGPNLEIYGPFEEEDMAALPEQVADVLVEKGRAEEVSGS